MIKLITTRRICQIFFLLLFFWFCFVANLGDQWWQLRGWPVNWFTQLDPLTGIATVLSTRQLYSWLSWSVVTIILTIFSGRFFCGWLCPFGTLQQFIGYLGKRHITGQKKKKINRYHPGQSIKYWLLIALLTMAAGETLKILMEFPQNELWLFYCLLALSIVGLLILILFKLTSSLKKRLFLITVLTSSWLFLGIAKADLFFASSLPISLLDPISLLHRSVNLSLLPLLDRTALTLSTTNHYYSEALIIGILFFTVLVINLWIPRVYCRFICPLGALFGSLSQFAPWRIQREKSVCKNCDLCEKNCEGACNPSETIRLSECTLCLNCIEGCEKNAIAYRGATLSPEVIETPDISKRGFAVSFSLGIIGIPLSRLNGFSGPKWNQDLIRPPGSLPEKDFLSRCIACGQCMKICPANVIQPAGLDFGIESLWTPVLDFQIGTSGCQHNCIACGNICPTSAIRPISIDERLGINSFQSDGPVKIGTAQVNRGFCLPWARQSPCIVCQEVCPVSPKAITTDVTFSPVQLQNRLIVKYTKGQFIEFDKTVLLSDIFSNGDYFCAFPEEKEEKPRLIVQNTANSITLSTKSPGRISPEKGSLVQIQLRLQKPFVNSNTCVGCGICEHDCPIREKGAIKVTRDRIV